MRRWSIGMDREIGRVLAQLRAMGALDNTLILFLSDNGASAEMMVRGDGHDPDGRVRNRRDVSEHRAGLVQHVQHAVPSAQDLGPRRRHLHAADRALAERDHRPRRIAAHARAHHRPCPDNSSNGRRQANRKVEGQASRPAPGKSLCRSLREMAPSPTIRSGGCMRIAPRRRLEDCGRREEIRRGSCIT